MKLLTVVVSHERLPLLKTTIQSYRATVTLPHRLVVVDNGSSGPVRRWIDENIPVEDVIMLDENRYPGYACNRGFALADDDVTLLHRSDSDMRYLAGWCSAMIERFADSEVALVGLRTDEEELGVELNTGGTAVIRRSVWDEGLRYSEKKWQALGTMTEDYWICQSVVARGYRWTRVKRPSVIHLASGDWEDPYYARSYGDRGIERPVGVRYDIYQAES